MNSAGARAPKYERLVELSADFDVPALTLIGEEELTRLFPGFATALGRADDIVERIRQTLGSFFPEDMTALEGAIQRLDASETSEGELEHILAPVFGPEWRRRRYAVRSAAIAEDLEQQSFAGIYESVLEVRGPVHLLNAVATVWRSGYSRGAILERLSGGVLARGNPICVIVQEMVEAELAGVAFSHDPVSGEPRCIVEAVAGTGDALVSGHDAGRRRSFSIEEIDAPGGDDPMHMAAQLCGRVAERSGGPVDIEWAYAAGRIHLLQARNITTLSSGRERSDIPVLAWTNLYGDEEGKITAFGDLPEFARYFRAKRKRIHDFARSNGLDRAAALLVRANGRALSDPALGSAFARSFTAPEAIIDINDQIRQIIVPRGDLLEELLRLMPDRERIQTFVVRDFVRGEIGLISEPAGDGEVVAEWTREGLLAINRGTAATEVFRIGLNGMVGGEAPPVPPALVERLHAATVSAQSELGRIRIEWVATGSSLFPVDFSEIEGNGLLPRDGDVISHGFCQGPVVVLDADTTLEALSIAPSVSLTSIPDAEQLGVAFGAVLDRVTGAGQKPVVVIDRPYAVLAALLPHVSGFVFERSSMLCHLAILIREQGLPAMQSPELHAAAQRSAFIRMDTRGGGLTLLEPAEALP